MIVSLCLTSLFDQLVPRFAWNAEQGVLRRTWRGVPETGSHAERVEPESLNLMTLDTY